MLQFSQSCLPPLGLPEAAFTLLKEETVMYYTRAQFAKLVGTTVETLRYYEDSGLLRVPYDASGKRYQYQETDIAPVMNILLCRAMGVSTGEMKDFSRHPQTASGLSLMNDQIEQIRLQIKYLVEMQDHLIAMKRRNGNIKHQLQGVAQAPRDDVYFLPLTGQNTGVTPAGHLREWVNAMPFSWTGVILFPEAWQRAGDADTVPATPALNISREYANKYLSAASLQHALYKPGRSAYKTVAVTADLSCVPAEAVLRLQDHAAQNGTRLTGPITGVLLDLESTAESTRFYIGLAADYTAIGPAESV